MRKREREREREELDQQIKRKGVVTSSYKNLKTRKLCFQTRFFGYRGNTIGWKTEIFSQNILEPMCTPPCLPKNQWIQKTTFFGILMLVESNKCPTCN